MDAHCAHYLPHVHYLLLPQVQLQVFDHFLHAIQRGVVLQLSRGRLGVGRYQDVIGFHVRQEVCVRGDEKHTVLVELLVDLSDLVDVFGDGLGGDLLSALSFLGRENELETY